MHRRLPFLMTFGFVATLALGDADAALRLVADGKSAYGVYHSPDAPESVKLAAREIQRVIKVSTGVELPIADTPREPMICLGENAEAKKAGLTADSLPDDGFRLVTKGSNLYILGKDTPADKPTWVAWISRGTLFGAYEFLESVVGARWLMPGEWGEDVPRHTTLSVPDLSVAKSPDFQIRSLVDIQDRKRGSDPNPQKTVEWLRRNKMPSTSEGRKLNLGHAWDQYLKPEDWEAHKDYLAMSADGKPRMFAKAAYVKFCTSNPALVNAFAQGVIRWLDERPQMRGASISPSDGGDFCQCSNCQALVTPDPHGKPSYTPVILRFANDVARIVGKKHPDRMLACYVYYNYMYPPDKPVAIEPNLYLVWAPLNYYGWGLQKPVYREEFPSIVKGWTSLTSRFVYHNYSTWMRSFNGAPLPPGFDILKLELPTLRKHGVQAAEMVGIGAWGYGAVSNYILVKQMWDAGVDVEATYREWLQRAYGPGWEPMDKLYMTLEARMKAWKEKESPVYRGYQYEVNYDVIDNVHRPVFADMERLYLDALSKVRTEAQRKRLETFGDNLVMLHYNMRKADMLPEPEKSAFYRTDEQHKQFVQDTEFSLALYRDHGKRYTGPIWKGDWRGD